MGKCIQKTISPIFAKHYDMIKFSLNSITENKRVELLLSLTTGIVVLNQRF